MSARVRRTVNHLGRQNINKKKKVELCSLEELDVEGMEGMLSKHAIAKAFLYWERKTVVLVHVYSTYTARPGRFFLPLSRAEIEWHVKGFHSRGSAEGNKWDWGQLALTFGATV